MIQSKPRYYIQEFHIVDTDSNPPKEFYIREILDSGSAEFELSNLSATQKLEIVAELGLDSLTKLLDECFKSNHKPYDASAEAKSAFNLLRKEVDKINGPN